ncbi:hypothetical protein Misp02_70430 [Microtetraspora sp. NBRC 16547]|nr:hypothetical protein Misp02_70430 [Microtetraspora sp. NBRC 16547]
MTLDWWVIGALLSLLAALAWPPCRAVLDRQRPHLLSGLDEAGRDEQDELVRAYAVTSIGAGWFTTMSLTDAWGHVAAYAAKRSTDTGIAYVYVVQGGHRWCWQRGRMTDSPAVTSEEAGMRAGTNWRPTAPTPSMGSVREDGSMRRRRRVTAPAGSSLAALTGDVAASRPGVHRHRKASNTTTSPAGPRHRREGREQTPGRWWTYLAQFAVGVVTRNPS